MKNLPFWGKIALAFSLTLLLTIALGSVSWLAMDKMDKATTIIETAYMPLLLKSSAIETQTSGAIATLKDYFAYGDERKYEAGLAQFNKAGETVRELQKQLNAFPDMRDFQKKADAVGEQVDLLRALVTSVADIKRVLDKKLEARLATAASLYDLCRDYVLLQQEVLRDAPDEAVEQRTKDLEAIIDEIVDVRLGMLRAQMRNSLADGKTFPARIADVSQRLNALAAMTHEERLVPKMDELRAAVAVYSQVINDYLTEWERFETQTPVRQKGAEDCNAKVQELSAAAVQATERLAGEVSADSTDSSRLIQILGVVTVLLTLAIAFWLTKIITDPISLCLGFAEKVAGGDLDRKLNMDRKDEMGRLAIALRSMVESLKKKIDEANRQSEDAQRKEEQALEAMKTAEKAGRDAHLRRNSLMEAADRLQVVAEVVSSASTEMSVQIEQSKHGAGEAAGRLSETAAAMEEMNNSVVEVARNAGLASEASTGTREKAASGSTIVEKAVQGIRLVRQDSLDLKQDMATLAEHANSITRIMGVISDIADQTNLLALNAAIEAARAGDAGRGFAVVADEVRKLAEKTMASTTDVAGVIQAIQNSAAQSVSQVDKAVASIEEVTDFANQSGEALQEIVAMAERTADQVRAIAAASEQQSASSDEINRSLTQVNAIAGGTAEAMDLAAHSVVELSNQARELTGLIEEMKRN